MPAQLLRATRLRLTASAGGAINLARREARIGGCKLDINGRQFSRLTGAAQRRLTAKMLQLLLRRPAAHLKRSPDWPGRDPVDSDAFRPELLGERFDVVHRRRLRLRIVVEIGREIVGLLR